jgi:hypothetical protein
MKSSIALGTVYSTLYTENISFEKTKFHTPLSLYRHDTDCPLFCSAIPCIRKSKQFYRPLSPSADRILVYTLLKIDYQDTNSFKFYGYNLWGKCKFFLYISFHVHFASVVFNDFYFTSV